ncbi:MAG: AAA family ATPase, partial [Christensenellaceae bacterium]
FKNTILILTSNLGSDVILEGIENGEITDSARESVNAILKRSFRPEFLNRLDDIVFYKPLTRENIDAIVDLMIGELNARLEEKQLSVSVTPAAKEYIVRNGYDPVYGARPLRRYLQSTVETLLAKKILRDNVAEGTDLIVDEQNGELIVR